MEENNDIFVAGGDALVHLAGRMYKKKKRKEKKKEKYSTKFFWGHPFSTYVS